MKSKWWLLGGIAAVLAVGVIALSVWFNSPGIHVLGKEIHIDITQGCYIIDGITGEVIDETAISIDGATSRADSEIFHGKMKVVGYENTASGSITSQKVIDIGEDGIWRISHLENCTHRETVDGVTRDVEHFCDLNYTYYLSPCTPDRLIVLIESFETAKPLYAISAPDEATALEVYRDFVT